MYLKNTKCCYFSLFIWCAEILMRKVVCMYYKGKSVFAYKIT